MKSIFTCTFLLSFALAYSQPSCYDLETQIIGYTMKTDRYRYTEWRHTKSGETKARELYDHQVDPDENKNVIDKEEYAERA